MSTNMPKIIHHVLESKIHMNFSMTSNSRLLTTTSLCSKALFLLIFNVSNFIFE